MKPGWAGLLDLILPLRCLGCGERLPGGTGRWAVGPLCGRCRAGLREPPHPRCPRCDFPRGSGTRAEDDCLQCRSWPPVLRAAAAAVVLEPPADGLVHGLKYGGWKELAPVLARSMVPHARGVAMRARTGATPSPSSAEVAREVAPCLAPIPTTPRRRRRRGYNQAGLLARALGGFLGWEVVGALERPEGGRTQVALGPWARRGNVEGAFRMRPGAGELLAGREVVLVDDVLTTGATVSAAARTLERASVTGVSVVAFARALPTVSTAGDRRSP